MIRLIAFILLLSACTAPTADTPSQNTIINNELSLFQPLVGKRWVGSGEWENKNEFKQEVEFSYDLNQQIVIAKTKGFVDQNNKDFGARNHGVRRYNKEKGQVEFYEFDVFGGLTTGEVFSEGKNIFYRYQYGDYLLTDMWEYVNTNQYNFKIGRYENDSWKQVYLNGVFKASN